MKNKHHMIISIEAVKAFDKTSQSFIIKNLTTQIIEGNFSNL